MKKISDQNETQDPQAQPDDSARVLGRHEFLTKSVGVGAAVLGAGPFW